MGTMPLIDRSDPNFDPDEKNIGYAEGILSDGRPYRLECWAVDQVTCLTIFVSTIDIEELSSDQVMEYLEEEGLFKRITDELMGTALKFLDKQGNEFWSTNVVIGDDEETYTTSTIILKPFDKSPSVGQN